MHLWPSSRLRDSFKLGYLKNLEWNLHRMNSEKKQSQSDTNQSKLLDSSDNGDSDSKQGFGVGWGALVLCREFLMLVLMMKNIDAPSFREPLAGNDEIVQTKFVGTERQKRILCSSSKLSCSGLNPLTFQLKGLA
ncbi:hypothetical protein RJ639_018378 [Escallonia herrerae]|uniref:Uncharacterized protein n=1 Tax=Escallonia herrerae TaxID=1293975 RepID=A0AA88V862_9ASTE|nr:hypothetical protein RJ639_018378 [Escallonia herrerae]